MTLAHVGTTVRADKAEEGTLRTLSGVVRSQGAGSEPLREAEVCWGETTDDGRQLAREPLCTSSDAEGRFSFAGVVCSKPLTLLAHAAGHQALRHVVKPPASCRDPVVLTLAVARFEITGTVLDAAGGGIAGALVMAQAQPSEELAGMTRSNADGHFRLPTPEGVLEVRVEADGYSMQRRVIAAPAESVVFSLLPASSIEGRVLAGGTGDPLADVRVEARNWNGGQEGPRAVLTRADGSFAVEQLVMGGYELRVVAESWRSTPVRVNVGVGEGVADVVLTAEPAASLIATVQVDGAPCRAGLVTLEGPDSAWQWLSKGQVRLLGLSPGHYAIDIRCSPRLRPQQSLSSEVDEQSAEASAKDELQLDAGLVRRTWSLEKTPPLPAQGFGNIRVSLSGTPAEAAGVVVRARRGVEPPLWGSRQGAATLFQRLPLGHYGIYLEQSPGLPKELVLDRDGQTVELQLAAPQHSIAGRVVDERGEHIVDVWVTASLSDVPPQEKRNLGVPALTDAHGAFALEGLGAGEYDLSATSPLGQVQLRNVPSGATAVVLTVLPYATLAGSVVSATGEPVETFAVRYTEPGNFHTRELLGAQGRWSLSSLVPGEYTLRFSSAEECGSESVVAAAGHEVEVNTVLQSSRLGCDGFER